MTWKEARKLLAKGTPVRRSLWDTYLIPHPTYGADRPIWNLPEHLHAEYPRRNYKPGRCDDGASDWQAT